MAVGIFGQKKVDTGKLCNLEVWRVEDLEKKRFGNAANDKLYAWINFSTFQPINYH